jgi:hypothetical protein
MKFISSFILVIYAIQGVKLQGCGPNEEYTDCGNLCEDSCANTCDPSTYLRFSTINPTNPACVPGCYCKQDFIRDDNGDCVMNKPNVCGKYLFLSDFLMDAYQSNFSQITIDVKMYQHMQFTKNALQVTC